MRVQLAKSRKLRRPLCCDCLDRLESNRMQSFDVDSANSPTARRVQAKLSASIGVNCERGGVESRVLSFLRDSLGI